MDGFSVMPMAEAARRRRHLLHRHRRQPRASAASTSSVMKDGAILANTGHFNVEIDIPALQAMAVAGHASRDRSSSSSTMPDGRRLFLLAEGRLVNLAAAEGHPAAVMDMSFANQALSAEWAVKNHADLEPQVYVVPGRHRRRDRPAQAEPHGRRDRHAHRRAGDATWPPGTRAPDGGAVAGCRIGAHPEAIVRLEDDALVLLDQTRLPGERGRERYADWPEVVEAIRDHGRARRARDRRRRRLRRRRRGAGRRRRPTSSTACERALAAGPPDRGQPGLGGRAMRDAAAGATPTPRAAGAHLDAAAAALHRRGGRALRAPSASTAPTCCGPARACSRTATPARSRPAATAPRSA